MRLKALVAAPLLTALLALSAPPLLAADVQAAAKGTEVASGLSNPRFLAFTASGQLYVTEAGPGEAEPDFNATPEQMAAILAKREHNGHVTRLGANGSKTPVANLINGGPAGLTANGETLYLAVGGIGPFASSVEAGPQDGTVNRVDPATGTLTKLADILSYEKAHNPDGTEVDSNLFGLTYAPDDSLYVADAGGNSLYRVDAGSGHLTLVAAFDGLPGSEPNPGRHGKSERDPVPTGVALGADGNIYVSLLGGAPFPPQGTKVVRVTPDGKVSDYATGLTALTALTLGPDQHLYATEMMSGMDMSGPEPAPLPGRVVRLLDDGSKQTVADQLVMPLGTAFDAKGSLYVVTNGTSNDEGAVLRFDNVARPASASDAGAPSILRGSAHGTLVGDSAGSYQYYTLPASNDAVTLTLSFGPYDAANAHSVGVAVYQDGKKLADAHGQATGLGDATNSSEARATFTPGAEAGPVLVQVYNYDGATVTYTLSAS